MPFLSQSDVMAEDLRSQLQDLAYGDFQTRWDALKRLTSYGDCIVEPLLDLLQDDQLDWEARWFAARGLASFDRPEIIDALLQLLAHGEVSELWQVAGEALSQIGPGAVMALSSQLHRPERRSIAVRGLAQIHHPAVIVPLLQLVEDRDPEIRRQVIASLGIFRRPEVTKALVQALNDPAPAVRIEAIQALAVRRQGEDDSSVKPLQGCLSDRDVQVVVAAIAALSRFPSEAIVDQLTALMADAHQPESVRLAAARSLGWMETPAALAALTAAQVDAPPKLQAEMIAALSTQPPHLGATAATALLARLPQIQQQPNPEPLLQALALALGRLGDKRAIAALRTLENARHEGVRLHSQAALRQLGAGK